MKNEIVKFINDGLVLDVTVTPDGETVWLTQQQMAELFKSSRTNIVEHIRNIYKDTELDEVSTCRKFQQVRLGGDRQVKPFIYKSLEIFLKDKTLFN